MPLRIVPLERRHLPACAELVGRLPLFEQYGFAPAAAHRLLEAALANERAVVLCAEQGPVLCGFAWFVRRGGFDRSGYLRLIAVDSDQQGKGAGRALVGELERRHLGEGGILVLTEAGNHSARRFYERLGYRAVGEIPDYVKPGLTERIYFKPPPH
jgi:ribosomal protein S18 acetylase RimI-like enzyme